MSYFKQKPCIDCRRIRCEKTCNCDCHYDPPLKESFLYYPDTHWIKLFMTDNPRFEDERRATQIEPRMTYVYQEVTTGYGMVTPATDWLL